LGSGRYQVESGGWGVGLEQGRGNIIDGGAK
jgi:hypothetical protein